jgi:hypothetical protein
MLMFDRKFASHKSINPSHGSSYTVQSILIAPLGTQFGHHLAFLLNPKGLTINQCAIHIPENGLERKFTEH